MKTVGETKVIGIDIGGTKLASALFSVGKDMALKCEKTLKNKILSEILEEGPGGKLTSDQKAERLLGAIVDSVEELSSGQGGSVRNIGICSAGFIENGVLVHATNIGVRNFPLSAKVAKHTGIRVLLYRDSWAPVFALNPGVPSIVFSIGTGFGGVSCNADCSIPLKSRTATAWPVWIPMLYCNDDPGYAVSFSNGKIGELILKGAARAGRANPDAAKLMPSSEKADRWAKEINRAAGLEGKVTPTKVNLTVAKVISPRAAAAMKAGEVYADFVGAAKFPPYLYELMSGQRVEGPDLDKKYKDGDGYAAIAFNVQAEFIGDIVFQMQRERVEKGLSKADKIFGTGSGYNKLTHTILSHSISDAIKARSLEYCAEFDCPTTVELIARDDMATTFACLGAATGAALGIGDGESG